MRTRTGRTTRACTAAALAGILLLTGCAGGEDAGPEPGAQDTTPTQSTSPTGGASPPAEPPATQQSTSQPSASESATSSGAIPENAADYGDEFIRAWGRGDASRMEQLATATAISTVQQLGGKGGGNWARISQSAGAGSTFLTYQDSGNGARLQLRVENAAASSATTQAVAEAKVIAQPIPGNAVDYADAYVRAWGVGDGARMEQLATMEVIDAMGQYGLKGGPDWKRSGQDAGAGSVYVTYTNSRDDWKLTLRIDNAKAGSSRQQAVVEAKFER